MDDVSCISINYNFIRRPAHKSSNILSYAARILIKINGKVYLRDDDFAILDFALTLRAVSYTHLTLPTNSRV